MSAKNCCPEYHYDTLPLKEKHNDTENQEVPITYGCGVRHVQLVILLLCIAVNFIARSHIGVTIVAMSNHMEENNVDLNTTLANTTTESITESTIVTNDKEIIGHSLNITSLCYIKQNESSAINVSFFNENKKFDWNKATQEMILGSFFVGYCIMYLPIGLVTQRWGGKIPLQISLFINGVISILAPWLIIWGGWKAVSLCRIVQGLSQAGLYPCIQTLLGSWAPVKERGMLSSYVYTGSTLGTVIGYQLGGILSDSRWGWPSTFWAVGVICLLTFSILTIFGSATPTQHNSISAEEKNYILGRVDDGIVRKRRPTPWKPILTCKPMWGIIATHVGSGVAFVFCFVQVPSYIHYVLGMNVKNSGILSSLPYICSLFSSVIFGLVSDYCTNKNIISPKNARRISNSVSQFGLAACLICASFTTSTAVAVAALVMSMTLFMGVHTGWMVNHNDLAPNYSGTLMSLGGTLMNVFIVLLPVMVTLIVTDVTSRVQWQIVFCAVAALAVVSNVIFILLVSTETQPWNDINEDGSDSSQRASAIVPTS